MGYMSLFNDYEKLINKYEEQSAQNKDIKHKYALELLHNQSLEKQISERDEKIKEQNEIISEQNKEIAELKKELEKKNGILNNDSTNSGTPTSQTPIGKEKHIPNSRQETNRKRGGQEGHAKHKLEKFADDEVTDYVEHKPSECPYCKSGKIKETGKIKTKDQQDIEIAVHNIRHIFKECECEECGKKFQENIPNNLKEDNQYGPNIDALILSLINIGCVSYNKTQKMINGMTNGIVDMSEGYIAKVQKKAADGLKEFNEEVKEELKKSNIILWDDTVIMIDKKRACLRIYTNVDVALFVAHMKKDKEGLDLDNILKSLSESAIVVHDHNRVNYNDDYDFQNAECNVHLGRDLKSNTDNMKHTWSEELKKEIEEKNKERNELKEKGIEEFPQEVLNEFNVKFSEIMQLAYKENEEDKNHYYAKKEHTLINRILKYKTNYFMWLYNFDIPYSNNDSERGLRDSKTKMKVSGQFINIENARYYASIRTYIETCYRRGINKYEALKRLCNGEPYKLSEILDMN